MDSMLSSVSSLAMTSSAPNFPMDFPTDNNDDQLNLSHLPPPSHTGTNNNNTEPGGKSVENETRFKPPMSVIVIQSSVSPSSSSGALKKCNHRFGSSCSGGQPPLLASSVGATTPTMPFSSMPNISGSSGGQSMMGASSSFRLQPRNNFKSIHSPARSMCSRGTKRRAHSISIGTEELSSSGDGDGADCSVTTEATFNDDSYLGTPLPSSQDPCTPRAPFVESAVATLRELSLQSPNQHSRLSGCGVSEVQSPLSLFGSEASLARSCFTKYNATSPAGSVSRTPPISPSPLRFSSSPRIAPLTVLAHNPQPTYAALELVTNNKEQVATTTPTKSCSKRPPLYGGMASYMHSLDDSAIIKSSSAPGGAPMTPPTHLPPHTSSPSSVQCHHTLCESSPERTPSQTGNLVVRAGEHQVVATDECLAHLETPMKKHARTDMMVVDSSPGMESVMSMSPASAPLPRLTLTPRSSTSRPRQLFPSMPSPTDFGVSIAPAATCSASAAATAQAFSARRSEREIAFHRDLPQSGTNSYIPLPDLGERHTRIDASAISNANCVHASSSLLAPSSHDDVMERFLAAQTSRFRLEGHCDGDSLSASDDDGDEAFFLATPSAMLEEKQFSSGHAKHRKLARGSDVASFSGDHFQSKFSFSSSRASLRASNTSLRGMDFVTSSASLDKDAGHAVASSFADLQLVNSDREESQVGLMLEEIPNPPSSFEGDPASTSSDTQRDVVTPPVMAEPKSPPPFRSQMDGGISLIPQTSNIYYHDGSSPPWPCAGEAESPLNSFTRVIITSTEPKGSPCAG